MKITGLSHLFKWENLHNWWLTKYFFAPLYRCSHFIHVKTVATEVEIQFLSTLISLLPQFGSGFFSSKERGVHIMNVQVIGVW